MTTEPAQNQPTLTDEHRKTVGAVWSCGASTQSSAMMGACHIIAAAEARAVEVALENASAATIHSCSDSCQRPMCVMRRENKALTAKLQTLEEVANLATRLLGLAQADSSRLTWLEEHNACLRFDAEDDASLPQAVVFLPTLENGESTFRAAGHGDTFREAIDAAMQPEGGK